MGRRKLTRKQIQEDRIQDSLVAVSDWVADNRSLLLGALGVFVLGFAGLQLWNIVSSGRNAEQHAKYYDALQTYRAPLETDQAAEQEGHEGHDHGDLPHEAEFKDAEERNRAALDKFEQLAREYAGSKVGLLSQYYVGIIRQQLDQPAEAEKNLRAVVDGADQPEIRQLAVNRLADVLYLQGKTEEAVTLWSEIAEDPAPTFPLNTVLKKLAEARQASGDLAKALELYRRLASEFPSDPDARLTDARIALLAGQVESNETPDAEESEEESSSE